MNVLDLLASKLGSNFPLAGEPAKFWYLSPKQHIIETIIANVGFISLILVALYIRKKQNFPKCPGIDYEDDDDDDHAANNIQNLPFWGLVLRTLLSACFIITSYHKYMGQKLGYMLMPCHFATLCYLYSMYTTNYRRANTMFNIAIHFMFFTVLALALPDFTHFSLFGEVFNFWAHHWILLIVPLYLLVSGHYIIDQRDSYYFLLAVGLGGLVHFDIQAPAGFLSGLNVNYLFWPPPKSPFKGQYFRWYLTVALVLCAWISGTLLPKFLAKKLLTSNSTTNEHTKQRKSHTRKEE